MAVEAVELPSLGSRPGQAFENQRSGCGEALYVRAPMTRKANINKRFTMVSVQTAQDTSGVHQFQQRTRADSWRCRVYA